MLVSVVIPTHNRPEALTVTLAALRRQTLAPETYDVIVVDDGSIPPLGLPAESGGPRVRVVRTSGVERSAARNAGAAAAEGRLLVFVDDDIEARPDFLAAHLAAQDDWPGALSGGVIRLPDPDLAPARDRPFLRFRQRLEDTGSSRERGPVPPGHAAAAGNMSIPRERFLALGGFDPALRSAEDQDLVLRHLAQGGTVVYLPEAGVVHHDSIRDLESYCRRTEWAGLHFPAFCRRYPGLPPNRERERINGAVRWGREPVALSLVKVLKSALARPAPLGALCALAHLLERFDEAAAERVYRLLLGLHLFRGYRAGARMPAEAVGVEPA